MKVFTKRFGTIEVPQSNVITMRKPILGFEQLSMYCIVAQDEFHPFMWLQSIEDPHVAFIIVNPVVFFPDYRVEVHSKEVADLQIVSVERVETYVIVTVPHKYENMSVNLQGPLLINTENNLGKQVVLVNSNYKIRQPLLDSVPIHEDEKQQVGTGELVGV